jgi:hypothetical protein
MPTVEIPDKICSCCGGVKWRVEKYTTLKKGEVTRYRCAINASKRTKKYYYLNINECRENNKLRQRKVNKTPKGRLYHRTRTKNEVENLTDNYIKKVIYLSLKREDVCKNLRYKEVSQDLIEIKRKQLLLTRQIKNNGKDSKNTDSNRRNQCNKRHG